MASKLSFHFLKQKIMVLTKVRIIVEPGKKKQLIGHLLRRSNWFVTLMERMLQGCIGRLRRRCGNGTEYMDEIQGGRRYAVIKTSNTVIFGRGKLQAHQLLWWGEEEVWSHSSAGYTFCLKTCSQKVWYDTSFIVLTHYGVTNLWPDSNHSQNVMSSVGI